jgi:hypothetical protein
MRAATRHRAAPEAREPGRTGHRAPHIVATSPPGHRARMRCPPPAAHRGHAEAGKSDHRSPVRLRTAVPPKRSLLPIAVAAATALAVAIPLAVASGAAAEIEPTGARDRIAIRAVDQDASFFVGVARGTDAAASGKVDTTALKVQIAQLDDSRALPSLTVAAFTSQLRTTTARVAQKTALYNAEQARKAAAARAAAAALARANTPDGARATARALAASRYGWGDGQFSCLSSLWQKESGWNYRAYNPSGATGIPQALPGSKMATAGADWQSSAATQISWGLDYIKRAYGSPCSAWGHSQAMNWY